MSLSGDQQRTDQRKAELDEKLHRVTHRAEFLKTTMAEIFPEFKMSPALKASEHLALTARGEANMIAHYESFIQKMEHAIVAYAKGPSLQLCSRAKQYIKVDADLRTALSWVRTGGRNLEACFLEEKVNVDWVTTLYKDLHFRLADLVQEQDRRDAAHRTATGGNNPAMA
jgi:hypothetical protein